MPEHMQQIDPESLVRGAVSSVALIAASRDISVLAHLDNRLPDRVAPCAAGLGDFLRRGLIRTIEAGDTRRIAVALWAESAGPDGDVAATLEVARTLDPSSRVASRLSDLWALPLGEGVAKRTAGRREERVESVLIPVTLRTEPGTPPAGIRWNGIFVGRRIIDVSDVLFDADRLRASLTSIGIDFAITQSADEALAMVRDGAASGRVVDVVALDGFALAEAAIAFAREIRGDPALARTKLILASAPRGRFGTDEITSLFDSTPWTVLPWRRLLSIVRDLISADAVRGEAPETRRAETGTGAEVAVPDLTGRRILIAEDVATNQVLLKAMLEPTGAVIDVVPDGDQALERHLADPADLILMDLHMPGTGGIAALKAIRSLEGPSGRVPVVALTAYARKADRRMAMEAGMDAYLPKPIVVGEFYRVLSGLLPA